MESESENLIMLCCSLPPRIYASLKRLGLANATAALQAHEIASAADLPPAETAKILQMMTWAGFVESRRGTKSGFWLATPANRVRVTDVTNFFAHHGEARRSDAQNGLLRALERATARRQKELSRITVADLAKASGCEPEERRATIANSARYRQKPRVRAVR